MASVMDRVGGKGSNGAARWSPRVACKVPLQESKGLSFGGPGQKIPRACHCQGWLSAVSGENIIHVTRHTRHATMQLNLAVSSALFYQAFTPTAIQYVRCRVTNYLRGLPEGAVA